MYPIIAMDRQEEFQKIVNIYLLADPSKQYDQQKQVNYEPSDLMQTALRVSTAVKTNEVSLAKMAKLCSRKVRINQFMYQMHINIRNFRLSHSNLGILK